MKQLILFTLLLLFLVACDKDPIPPLSPTIITGNASNVENSTATVSLSISDASKTKEMGVLYSLSSSSLTSISIENFTSGDNTVSLTGLLPGTIYYYKAYATDGHAFVYGEIKSFTTGIDYPSLTTISVSSITSTQAICGGNITLSGGGSVNARGVCWSTASDPTIATGKTTDGTGTGAFASSISGLSPNTTYYVRAYATNEKGTAYGAQVTFATLPISIPTITTTSVTSITATTATSGGNITHDGGATVTARGVCWSANSDPTISNNKTSNGNSTGTFTSSITGLTAGTTYYVRAFATNTAGTAYGSTVSFKATDGQIINNQTINGYTLSQNEIWSGTISLKGDIVVPSGITLTINPGTIINISTGTPVYDEGHTTGIIDFFIQGSLIINGTAQNIVQLKSTASSPTNKEWGGINMMGDRLEINYCYISDARGVYSSGSSNPMKIKNCLFKNMIVAIGDFGSIPHTLSYNSFINVDFGYYYWVSNKNQLIDHSEFKNNKYYDLYIVGSKTYGVTNNASINVNYSNFSGNSDFFFNLYWSSDGGVTNSNITANHCYGITTYPTNDGYGNTYTYTNQLSAPYSGAGCGFSMGKSASVRSYTIGNPDQEKRSMQEHNEEIMRINEKMKHQQTN
jgi:hypothetical protein